MQKCKFEKKQYQVSYDDGVTWENVSPAQFTKGELIEYDSPDCDIIDTIYRWRVLDGQYICEGNNKYVKEIRDESYDGGVTWYTSYPTVYRAGMYVGIDEEFCNDKFEGHYIRIDELSICPFQYVWNGHKCIYIDPLKVIKCMSNNTILSSGDTAYYITPNIYALISCKIGSCVSKIEDNAFRGYTHLSSCTIANGVSVIGRSAFLECRELTSIDIPNSVTTIEENAFLGCTSLRTCTIGSGVTSIGSYAFYNCGRLTSVTINATTPPTLGTSGFTGSYPIYVPCESLNLYRQAPVWSSLYRRIYGMPPCTPPSKLYAEYNDSTTLNLECDNNPELIEGAVQSHTTSHTAMTSAVIGECITSIGKKAFYGCTSLSSITIPNSVTSIGENAFYECTSLSSITIPDTVTSIGTSAFQYCSGLTSVFIPSSVISVGNFGFTRCTSLTSCTIERGVSSIGDAAFFECINMEFLNINAITIGENAFYACSGLTDITIGDTISSIKDYAFYKCSGLTSITVGATVPPTLVGEHVFGYTNNCPIYVPCVALDTYKSASGWSAYASRIHGISPCSEYRWTNLDPSTDYYCSGTTKYYKQQKQVSTDGGQTWQNVSPAEYRMGSSAETRSLDCGYEAKFLAEYNDGSTKIVDCDYSSIISSSTTKGYNSYKYQSMTSAKIGSCVTKISGNTFSNCFSLTSVTIPNTVTSIGRETFRECDDLINITIPSGVTVIEWGTFYNCNSLTSVTIPNGVTSIGGSAFISCDNLTSIDIPDSVTSIGNYAFSNCSGLTSITVEATTPPTLGTSMFDNTNDCPIYVPCLALDTYKAAWPRYASRIHGISPCSEYRWTDLDPSTDYYCSGTTKYYKQQKQVSTDGGQTWQNVSPAEYRMGSSAETQSEECGYIPQGLMFKSEYSDSTTYSAECDSSSAITSSITKAHTTSYTKMTKAIIGDCVTSIDHDAFYYCSGLTSIYIPDSVTDIGYNAFYYCSSLSAITIPSGVTAINSNTFFRCSSLSSVTIPNGVTSIGDGAFKYCDSLTSIEIPNSVTSIGMQICVELLSLRSVTIGSGVTSIGMQAFYYCRNLTSITINATTPPSIGNNDQVFDNTNDCPIYVPSGSVNTYKAAWAMYASRIQAIP